MSLYVKYLQKRQKSKMNTSQLRHNQINRSVFPVCKYIRVPFLRLWRGFSFSIWFFFSQPPANNRTAGEGEGIPLTPHCHFHPLHRYLGNSWAIAAEGSPLRISSKPYTNRGTLVSNRKSLTTRLRTLFLKFVSNDLV